MLRCVSVAAYLKIKKHIFVLKSPVYISCILIMTPQVMRGYFPSILALAQGLLRSPDPCVVPFGGHMYRHSFTAFDSYSRQVSFV